MSSLLKWIVLIMLLKGGEGEKNVISFKALAENVLKCSS